MVFKLVGGALVMLGGALTALMLDRALNERLSRLDALLSLLRFIRAQIDCFCLPVEEIFGRVDDELLSACGVVSRPRNFDELISGLEPTPDEQVMKLLRSFSLSLGASYREEQLKSSDYHISSLTAIRDKLASEIGKRKKLNTTLCLSAAAAIVILFI